MTPSNIQPFFMWAGGKTKMLKGYAPLWPRKEYSTYIEPFLGAGAVYSWLCNNTVSFDKVMLNDINHDIMDIFNAVKLDKDEFITNASDIAKSFLAISPHDKESRKGFYYTLRKSYWDDPQVPTLYILMRLGFNGIWQTCKSSHGLFGTPAGLLNQTRMEQIINPALIGKWYTILQNAELSSMDYSSIPFNPHDCLVYLDPPYRGSFTTYGTGFNDDEQMRLCEWSMEQASNGATVLLANRDNGDGFFEDILGTHAEFHYFDVTYTAGRRRRTEDGDYDAKTAREFLAVIT